jgi:hypothetical protein
VRRVSSGGESGEGRRRTSDERSEFATGCGLAGRRGANDLGLGMNVLFVQKEKERKERRRDSSAPTCKGKSLLAATHNVKVCLVDDLRRERGKLS